MYDEQCFFEFLARECRSLNLLFLLSFLLSFFQLSPKLFTVLQAIFSSFLQVIFAIFLRAQNLYILCGFQLLDLIITELKSHMNCKKFKCPHWWKFYLSKENPLQDLLSSLNAFISTNERHWIITGHVTFKLRYNQI